MSIDDLGLDGIQTGKDGHVNAVRAWLVTLGINILLHGNGNPGLTMQICLRDDGHKHGRRFNQWNGDADVVLLTSIPGFEQES